MAVLDGVKTEGSHRGHALLTTARPANEPGTDKPGSDWPGTDEPDTDKSDTDKSVAFGLWTG